MSISYFQTSKVLSPVGSTLVLSGNGNSVQLASNLDFQSTYSLINGTTANFATSVTTPLVTSTSIGVTATSGAITLTPGGANTVTIGANGLNLGSYPLTNGTTAAFTTSVTTPLLTNTSGNITITPGSSSNVIIGAGGLNLNGAAVTSGTTAVFATSVTSPIHTSTSSLTLSAQSGGVILTPSGSNTVSITSGTGGLNLNNTNITGANTITATASTALTLAAGSGQSVVLSSPLNVGTNAVSGITTLGVSGLISSPTGLTFTTQSSNPGGSDTLWVNTSTNHINFGSVDLQTTTNLQSAYNNSTVPEIVLTSGVGALTIRDASTTIGTLFTLQNNGGTSTYFSQSSSLATFGTNVLINGNLNVNGTTTSINTVNTSFSDAFLFLNDGYTGTSGSPSGLAVNYQATTNATTIASSTAFTVGVSGTNAPSVHTTGGATFAAGDIIQIHGSEFNDALYEVASYVTSTPYTLTIKGVGGTANVEAFTATNFTTETTTATVSVTKVNVSILRANSSTGLWQNAVGSNTGAGLSYYYHVLGPTTSTNTAIPTWNGTNGSALSNTSVTIDGSNNLSGANSVTISQSSQTSTGTAVLSYSTAASASTIVTKVIQNSVQTSSTTVTTINAFTIPNISLLGIKTIIVASDTSGDTASFTLEALFKTNSSGVISGVGTVVQTVFLDSTPNSQGWSASFNTGTANSLLLQVTTGTGTGTVQWQSTSSIYTYTF